MSYISVPCDCDSASALYETNRVESIYIGQYIRINTIFLNGWFVVSPVYVRYLIHMYIGPFLQIVIIFMVRVGIGAYMGWVLGLV